MAVMVCLGLKLCRCGLPQTLTHPAYIFPRSHGPFDPHAGKVFLCYFLFYAILSTWMVIHISVMVSLLPSRDSFCNSETNYNNLQFCMGEPNYHSWLTKRTSSHFFALHSSHP